MMDDAEAWLRENDPEYEQRKRGWKYLEQPPSQESCLGDAESLGLLVEYKEGRWVVGVDHKSCERCKEAFAPLESWHRYCSDRCRWAEQKSRQRMSAQSDED